MDRELRVGMKKKSRVQNCFLYCLLQLPFGSFDVYWSAPTIGSVNRDNKRRKERMMCLTPKTVALGIGHVPQLNNKKKKIKRRCVQWRFPYMPIYLRTVFLEALIIDIKLITIFGPHFLCSQRNFIRMEFVILLYFAIIEIKPSSMRTITRSFFSGYIVRTFQIRTQMMLFHWSTLQSFAKNMEFEA